ncbi:MAG: hypothetical protein AAGM38_02455 [Pseudomonadota bacterium]
MLFRFYLTFYGVFLLITLALTLADEALFALFEATLPPDGGLIAFLGGLHVAGGGYGRRLTAAPEAALLFRMVLATILLTLLTSIIAIIAFYHFDQGVRDVAAQVFKSASIALLLIAGGVTLAVIIIYLLIGRYVLGRAVRKGFEARSAALAARAASDFE